MKKEIIMALAISTTNLVKNFDGKNAVNGISLDVHQGEIFGILGPNGAGKTTFLRMIATLTTLLITVRIHGTFKLPLCRTQL